VAHGSISVTSVKGNYVFDVSIMEHFVVPMSTAKEHCGGFSADVWHDLHYSENSSFCECGRQLEL